MSLSHTSVHLRMLTCPCEEGGTLPRVPRFGAKHAKRATKAARILFDVHSPEPGGAREHREGAGTQGPGHPRFSEGQSLLPVSNFCALRFPLT